MKVPNKLKPEDEEMIRIIEISHVAVAKVI